MVSATLHVAVLAAFVAAAMWATRGREVVTGQGHFVLVPSSVLASSTPAPRNQDALPGDLVRYTPTNVVRVRPVTPAPVAEPLRPVVIKPSPPARSSRLAPLARPVRVASAPVVPQIDGDALAANLLSQANTTPNHGRTRPVADSLLVGYFDRLVFALRAAHEMPDGVDTLYVAKVSFFLAADGSISAVRVLEPSGNPDYDRSVLEAFAKVRSIGAVPGQQSGVREIYFRMME